jgi:hypothetical protein
MFEPLTLTLAELAVRWNLTPRQVLQHAQQPGVPLYFAFEGLVFDNGEHWLRDSGDWLETGERDALVKSVESGEAWLRRRRDGRLTEWDQLSEEEAQELRTEIEENKIKIRDLNELLAGRDAERNRRHFRGFLRVGPSTLWDIESLGSAPFPHKAFHPSSPVKVVRLPDGPRGDGGLVWDGRIVALEPLYESDPHWKKRLTADDLVAITNEVKAIETHNVGSRNSSLPPGNSESGERQVPDGTASTIPAVSESEPNELGLSKRERQIIAIIREVRALQYDPMSVPDGGKSILMKKCMASRPDLFGAGQDPFKEAWQEGVDQGRLRMANHHRYSTK